MKQHLIALDLDGTLLKADQSVSPFTKEILLEAKEAGHIIVIATGRPNRSSIQFYHKLGLTTPMINYNGSFIHHPKNNKWEILHNPVNKKTALSIVDACYDLGVKNIIAEVADQVYLERHDQKIMDVFYATQHKEISSPITIGRIRNELKDNVTALLIHPEEHHIDELATHLNLHHAEVTDHRIWRPPWNIFEISKKGTSKAFGLQKLAQYYNIPKERIIAFGDENNDLEMIDYAGVGVAMGNAIDELKSVAKHVTKTNEADGIGIFLEEYLNIKVKIS